MELDADPALGRYRRVGPAHGVPTTRGRAQPGRRAQARRSLLARAPPRHIRCHANDSVRRRAGDPAARPRPRAPRFGYPEQATDANAVSCTYAIRGGLLARAASGWIATVVEDDRPSRPRPVAPHALRPSGTSRPLRPLKGSFCPKAGFEGDEGGRGPFDWVATLLRWPQDGDGGVLASRLAVPQNRRRRRVLARSQGMWPGDMSSHRCCGLEQVRLTQPSVVGNTLDHGRRS